VRRVAVALLLLLAGLAGVPAGHAATAANPFAGCQAAAAPITIGAVACRLMPSADLGGTTAFEYFVPPGCAPALHRRCPTLYLLHGFGGDLTSMLGTRAAPSAWVAALSRQPAVSPYATRAPWQYANQTKWRPAAPIDMVLIAPDGRTVPHGYGPGPWLEGFWADWNPKYAHGGADPKYPTPPPRFASFVTDELIPLVEQRFPVGRGRPWRALAGTSLGGYGSYAIGLMHPDEFANIGAVSGIMNVLLLPGIDPPPGGGPLAGQPLPGQPLPGQPLAGQPPVAGQPPAPVPVASIPGPLGAGIPLGDLPEQARGFAVAFYAFGDPNADQAYFRGLQPVNLALNASAHRGHQQAIDIRGFSNDTVPRMASDFDSPPDYLSAQAFEALVFESNVELNRAFADEGIRQHYELHPGIHEDAYWNPWLRVQVAAQYAAVRHWDGTGTPPLTPTSFSYRSIADSFDIWGWRVRVSRPVVEFLQLSDVSCHGLTLRGSGVVMVNVPANCHTGDGRSRTFRVDLGPSMPTDAPAGADALPEYGRTEQVSLTRLR
jgi:S-formylglutathione hydrolase FrmB